jgi:hypothetical protein
VEAKYKGAEAQAKAEIARLKAEAHSAEKK